MSNQQLDIAVRLMAGLCANPSVFAYNNHNGWSLVNCEPEQLAEYSMMLACALMKEAAR